MFMNWVHEQRPKIDSGTIPSQNGSKNRPSAPSAQPKARPRTQRPGRAHASPLLRTAREPRARLPVVRLCLPAMRALAARPACRAPRLPRALCSPRLRAQLLTPHAHAPTHARLCAPNEPCAPSARLASALHAQPAQPPQSRYKFCIVTHPAAPGCHNTIDCIATQSSIPP